MRAVCLSSGQIWLVNYLWNRLFIKHRWGTLTLISTDVPQWQNLHGQEPLRYWCFCLSLETWSLKLNLFPNFEKLEYFVFAVTLSSPAISSWDISGSCCCYGTTISWHILNITHIPSSCANEMHQQKLTYIIRKHEIDTWIRFVCLVILFIVGFKYVWYLYSQTLDISGTLA